METSIRNRLEQEQETNQMARINTIDFTTTNGCHLIFRNALPKEGKSIQQFIRQSYDESPYLATRSDEFVATTQRVSSWIESHLESPGKLMIVAEQGKALVGLLDFSNSRKQRLRHVGEFGLSVKQDWQGLGIGCGLLSTLIDWSSTSPVIEKLELQVFVENQRAIALYRSFGFETEGIRRHAVKYVDQGADQSSDANYTDIMMMGKFVGT